MDITFIPMRTASSISPSCRVLSWRFSIPMEAAFCGETLEDALGHLQHRSGLAVHRGCLHMDGNGAWRDNVFVERL
ncbi:hypothetical protein M2427_008326 [Bradyrhizobium sp. BR13661]|jgi:putative transposase|nr:hypothetical protein [Bradyrhizobium sp. BR13661]